MVKATVKKSSDMPVKKVIREKSLISHLKLISDLIWEFKRSKREVKCLRRYKVVMSSELERSYSIGPSKWV